MTTMIINSDTSLQTGLGLLRELYLAHRYVKVSAKTGKAKRIADSMAGQG